MVLNKWAVPILQLAFVIFTALQALRADYSVVGLVQFIGIAIGAAFTVYLPLTSGRWTAVLKVLSALVGAVIAAIIPLVTQAWTVDSTIIVLLAIVNALVVQFGVDARIDGVKKVITSSGLSNTGAYTLDPAAYKVAVKDPTVAELDTEPLF